MGPPRRPLIDPHDRVAAVPTVRSCWVATIEAGILGPPDFGRNLTAPSQLAVAKRAFDAKVIFLNVGADDRRWDAPSE